ncbi:hypothetical protein ACFW1A_09630 [Kitasatospora sp. NPDC058965]|uniref:hypothetical protein n=1 Tax=Kitasatospora sp. NPDC058965 TaxID=3346682 RepID=UPI00369E3A90
MSVATTITDRLHGRRAEGVPRWAARAALAVTLCTLPSCLWRIAAFALDAPLVERGATAPAGHGPELVGASWWYVSVLSLVSEALALLAYGLVSRWGEVWPRWVPGLAGRRVPVAAAVVPAGLGATALLVFPYALLMFARGRMLDGSHAVGLVTHGAQTVAFWVAYLPLAAWGPLLGVLTAHYYRRRRRTAPSAPAA